MNARLAFAMIQRQHRGVTPPRTITAPLADMRDHTTEADRLSYFDQSARTTGGKVAPFNPLPDVSMREANALFAQRYAAEAVPDAFYEQDLREGFALKYQEEA